MKVLFALDLLVIATVAVRVPGSPGSSAVQNQGSYSPITFVVVPRQAPGSYHPGIDNSFSQLYQEENISIKSTPTVKTKRVVTIDDRFRNPYAIPRRKLNYRQTENAPVQYLKEVTPTTMTVFEEQQQQQDTPIYRFTETSIQEEDDQETVAQITQPEPTQQSRLPLDVQNLEQMRSIVFVQPDFNAMQLLQQVQSQEELFPTPQVPKQNINPLLSLNTDRFPKPAEVQKKIPKKDQRPLVFPRVNEDTDDVVNTPVPVPIQPRLVPNVRQVQYIRPQLTNFEFRNAPIQTQAYSKKLPQNYYRQPPQILPELPYRYKLQLVQPSEKQDQQLLQFPAYFNQAQMQGLSEENADAQNKPSENSLRQAPKLNKVKLRPVKLSQDKNVAENGNAKVNYQPELFYPNYRYRLFPYPTYQYQPSDKQRTVQILQNEEEQGQGEDDEEDQ